MSGRSRGEAIGPLQGLSVLVLENDYLQADDLGALLREAGAEVVGPFPSAALAIAAAKRRKPACAVLDLDLGQGPTFDAARALAALGVPIMFVTGYDAAAIPDALRRAPLVSKPWAGGEILAAIATLCATGALAGLLEQDAPRARRVGGQRSALAGHSRATDRDRPSTRGR